MVSRGLDEFFSTYFSFAPIKGSRESFATSIASCPVPFQMVDQSSTSQASIRLPISLSSSTHYSNGRPCYIVTHKVFVTVTFQFVSDLTESSYVETNNGRSIVLSCRKPSFEFPKGFHRTIFHNNDRLFHIKWIFYINGDEKFPADNIIYSLLMLTFVMS